MKGPALLRGVIAAASAIVLALGVGFAQNDADTTLEQARAALATADASDGPRSPDAAPWAEAIDAALRARDASGDPPSAAALRTLASAYQGARWWVRAAEAWDRLDAVHGPLDGSDLLAWRDATTQLAYARYQAGDPVGAADRFERVLERLPSDVEALRWSGRIALELDRPNDAIPFWERLLAIVPDDAGARFHLELARERAAHGRVASDAYRDGLAYRSESLIDAAIDAFARAERADPTWTEPLRWRARTLLEAGRPGAVEAWRALAERVPGDADVSYFLARAELQAVIGRPALLASDEARSALRQGDPNAALEAWQRALDAAPTWREARLGVARAATASGDAERAEAAWSALLATLEDGDPLAVEARQGLATARLLERLGGDAARAYVAAEAAFERGEVDLAVGLLEEVADAAPDAPEPWAFLGRIAFVRADWMAAARAYERAAELDPSDADLAFFAAEARALAGPEPDAPSDGSGDVPADDASAAPRDGADDGAVEPLAPDGGEE